MKNVILFTWFSIVLCIKLTLFGRNGVSQTFYSRRPFAICCCGFSKKDLLKYKEHSLSKEKLSTNKLHHHLFECNSVAVACWAACHHEHSPNLSVGFFLRQFTFALCAFKCWADWLVNSVLSIVTLNLVVLFLFFNGLPWLFRLTQEDVLVVCVKWLKGKPIAKTRYLCWERFVIIQLIK